MGGAERVVVVVPCAAGVAEGEHLVLLVIVADGLFSAARLHEHAPVHTAVGARWGIEPPRLAASACISCFMLCLALFGAYMNASLTLDTAMNGPMYGLLMF